MLHTLCFEIRVRNSYTIEFWLHPPLVWHYTRMNCISLRTLALESVIRFPFRKCIWEFCMRSSSLKFASKPIPLALALCLTLLQSISIYICYSKIKPLYKEDKKSTNLWFNPHLSDCPCGLTLGLIELYYNLMSLHLGSFLHCNISRYQVFGATAGDG